ncbi:autophagy-related protein 13-like [Tubulanus polymorphus]|uniref:autophagy-related protein 13-like n=1 Tax=Tubulanus polymorphus TaxID=672921 RepID=UPI003DA50808
MAAGKLSSQDRKDLDKFTKFLIYKSVQIIVQSRLGEKVKTQSKPFSSGSDWFNLAIRDIPEVLGETKKALASQLINTTQSICVEISLKTADGDTMVLETWSLGMNEQCDPLVKVSYMVYNCMGILLKSLMCVLRVTPAYRLSRSQGPDNYVICYRIYKGTPNTLQLGAGFDKLKVGTVPTPCGTIVLDVSYRTKMLISPQHSIKDLSIDAKDDHFKQDSPKKSSIPRPCHFNNRRNSTSEEGSSISAESEICATTFSTSPPDPYCRDMNNCQTHCCCNHNGRCTDNRCEGLRQPKNIVRCGAFAPVKVFDPDFDEVDDIPFSKLYIKPKNLTSSPEKRSEKSDSDVEMENGKPDAYGTDEVDGNESDDNSHASGPPDDFVMIDMKAPFAGHEGTADLGRFYRECQGAPVLAMFDNQPSIAETLDVMQDQLVSFESNAKGFDEFVNNLDVADG